MVDAFDLETPIFFIAEMVLDCSYKAILAIFKYGIVPELLNDSLLDPVFKTKLSGT